MTTIMIILACGFYQILHVSVWLFIVMYALVRLPPPTLVKHFIDNHFIAQLFHPSKS